MKLVLLLGLLTFAFSSGFYQRNRKAEEDKKRDSAILEALLEKLEKQGEIGLAERELENEDPDDGYVKKLLDALELLDERALDDIDNDDGTEVVDASESEVERSLNDTWVDDDGTEVADNSYSESEEEERSLDDAWMEEKLYSVLLDNQPDLRDVLSSDGTSMMDKRGSGRWKRKILRILRKLGKRIACLICRGSKILRGRGFWGWVLRLLRRWTQKVACRYC